VTTLHDRREQTTDVHIVRCNGTTHRIAVGPRGRIALIDHGSVEAELAAAEIAGGDAPECVELVRRIRSGAWDELPPWATALRRPDRRKLEYPPLIAEDRHGIRWLAERWYREYYPAIHSEVASIASRSQWTLRSVRIEWGGGLGKIFDQTVFDAPKFTRDIIVYINPWHLYQALLIRLPKVLGCVVFGIASGKVCYAKVYCDNPFGFLRSNLFYSDVDEWMEMAKKESDSGGGHGEKRR
jgi:hypothetical protein